MSMTTKTGLGGRTASSRIPWGLPSAQGGAVLLIALLALVAMTLSALALIRSVNMTNLISGNLAFRESAVLSSERSTELALAWLSANSAAIETTLHEHNAANGYRAVRADPADGANWDTFWKATLADQSAVVPTDLPENKDVAGNTVAYVIHRLCEAEGHPQVVNCSKPPTGNAGGSQSAGGQSLSATSQVYYRITSRVAGPRNPVVYTQTIVAL